MPGIHIVISLKGAKLQILNLVLIWQRRAKRQFISTFFFFFCEGVQYDLFSLEADSFGSNFIRFDLDFFLL